MEGWSMGVRNRERREAKKRKARRGGSGGGAVPRQLSVAEAIEAVVGEAVAACSRVPDPGVLAECVAELTRPELVGPVDRVLLAYLEVDIDAAWQRGWQPADLTRMAARELGAQHARVMGDGIAGRMRAYPAATVDSRWDEQLRAIGATV